MKWSCFLVTTNFIKQSESMAKRIYIGYKNDELYLNLTGKREITDSKQYIPLHKHTTLDETILLDSFKQITQFCNRKKPVTIYLDQTLSTYESQCINILKKYLPKSQVLLE